MRRVIIESPYAGDIQLNTHYARLAVKDCLSRGEAPIASHLLYTQPGVLDDGKPDERKLGIAAGHAWIDGAAAVVVYTDLGVSPGMEIGIGKAYADCVKVEFRQIKGFNRLDYLEEGDFPESVSGIQWAMLTSKHEPGEKVKPPQDLAGENRELHDQIAALSDELQRAKDDLAEADKQKQKYIRKEDLIKRLSDRVNRTNVSVEIFTKVSSAIKATKCTAIEAIEEEIETIYEQNYKPHYIMEPKHNIVFDNPPSDNAFPTIVHVPTGGIVAIPPGNTVTIESN